MSEIEVVEISVKCSNGDKSSYSVEKSMTVREFKEEITKQTNIEAELQRLIYRGRVLKDECSLESYGE